MLKLSLLLFTLSTSLLTTTGLAANDLLITTANGKLLGEYSNSSDSIRVFKSIPFALPPTGTRRWKPAEPPSDWVATRSALQFSPDCIQPPYPENTFFSSTNAPTSEDCLYLNIWAPRESGEKIPVMVWIHGGGLTRGSGSTGAYDGTALAKKGVLLVTINYRLGIFGYFAHPELSAESPQDASGNYGTTDQIAALKWIRDNIQAFGGDAGNITIFGESAGSFSVNHLMASPLAKNLFHRAIGQSGSALGPMNLSNKGKNSGESQGMHFASTVGANSLRELRDMPATELLAKSLNRRFEPLVDGWVFPDTISNIFKAGKQNAVPLIVGFNADEGTTLGVLSAIPEDANTYIQTAKSRMGPLSDEFLTIYPADDLKRSTLEAFRDSFVTWGMQTWAMAMQQVEKPAYLYYFSHWPNGEQLGAYHAGEIIYAFDNVEKIKQAVTEDDISMASSMSDYWISFAKTGNPNNGKLPIWKPYSKTDRNYIEFKNGESIPGVNLLPGRWEFIEKVNAARQNLSAVP
jgi:para-nitrobenzyl esterase